MEYTWREDIGCLCGGAEEVGPGLKYMAGIVAVMGGKEGICTWVVCF